MEYKNMVKGTFVSRPNRFIANVRVEDQVIPCHVKNTGRCRELLVEGATLYLEDHQDNMRNRKLRFSVINVEKKVDSGTTLLVNMDSLAPNKVVREALLGGVIEIPGFEPSRMKLTMEKTFGSSRFDILLEQEAEKAFIEVKGVTLEEARMSRFPDAPTERGVKHVEELMLAKEAGYQAYVIFVLQMEGMLGFRPNDEMHPQFGEALRRAAEKGVVPLAYDCMVSENSLHISRKVSVNLYNIL